mmetsp:Transcript_75250/g.178793  ORF Transcript_75250/g.178793 Transcript_75250/m.178793 type:complete len:545 (+) Transcript_75250:32-1666(+)
MDCSWCLEMAPTRHTASKSAPLERLSFISARRLSPIAQMGVAPLLEDAMGVELFQQEAPSCGERRYRRRIRSLAAESFSPRACDSSCHALPRRVGASSSPLVPQTLRRRTGSTPAKEHPGICLQEEPAQEPQAKSADLLAGEQTRKLRTSPAQPWLRIVTLFTVVVVAGTATNVAFEFLGREEQQCASVLTLCQYVSVIAGALPRALQHLREPKIPRKWHLLFAALMTMTAVCGNKSVDWHIPFPLYLIIKSSNLVSNLCVGGLMLGKRYRGGQVVGVLVMTLGVIFSTLMANSNRPSEDEDGGFNEVLVGCALCAISTISMSLLSCAQEHAFAKFGKHYEESLFIAHALGLIPILYLEGVRPWGQLHRWSFQVQDLAWAEVPFVGLRMPYIWLLLFVNLGACHACKHAFFALLGTTSSLTATFAVMSYRFIGICLSSFVFNAPPLPPMSMSWGIALVIVGGLTYLAYSRELTEGDNEDEDMASSDGSSTLGRSSSLGSLCEPQPEPSPGNTPKQHPASPPHHLLVLKTRRVGDFSEGESHSSE